MGHFVESHGREVMDIINPTNRKRIAQVRSPTRRTLGARSPPNDEA
jgi:hypothetical protein